MFVKAAKVLQYRLAEMLQPTEYAASVTCWILYRALCAGTVPASVGYYVRALRNLDHDERCGYFAAAMENGPDRLKRELQRLGYSDTKRLLRAVGIY